MLGGVAVLAVGKATGWLGGTTTKTVVVAQPTGTGDAAPVVVAKPLAGNGFAPAQIFRSRSAGVVTILSYFDEGNVPDATAAQGSGFVVSPQGLILTNAHVITNAGLPQVALGKAAPSHTVYVEFADGDRVPATVVGFDLYDDVGVIRVDPALHALDPVPLGNSNRVVVGEPVAAIGSPFGNTDSLSVGVISAIRRSIPSLTSKYNLVDAIQTDAPINHGNSGGPLFDARGRAIGINAQIRSSGAGSGFEGVGFAVPINSARRSMQQLLANGTVRYAYVGITTEDLTPAIAKKFGYAAHRGALIDAVTQGRRRRPGGARRRPDRRRLRGSGPESGRRRRRRDRRSPRHERRGRGSDRHRTAAARRDRALHDRPRRAPPGRPRDARRTAERLASRIRNTAEREPGRYDERCSRRFRQNL